MKKSSRSSIRHDDGGGIQLGNFVGKNLTRKRRRIAADLWRFCYRAEKSEVSVSTQFSGTIDRFISPVNLLFLTDPQTLAPASPSSSSASSNSMAPAN
ncbi:hypothetical protein SDJN02_11960, partial [Cucurbita argyrosperma subsp. argyrosperma]